MTNTSIFAAFERMWQHITVALNGKSDIFHNHDDKYYTQEHVDENFALKSDLQNIDLSALETKTDAQLKYDELVATKAEKNHSHSWNELEDRPFYETEVQVPVTINWDGGKTDKNTWEDSQAEGWVFISDKVVNNYQDLIGANVQYYCKTWDNSGDYYNITLDEGMYSTTLYMDNAKGYMFRFSHDLNGAYVSYRIVVLTEDAEVYGTPYEKGIYFGYDNNYGKAYVSSLDIGTEAQEVVKTIDTKYLPDTIARTEYVDENFALKSDFANIDLSKYETKTDSQIKLDEAKAYADSAASTVKDDLLNGAGDAYDTLLELGVLIDENHDAIDALEIVASNKSDKGHTHTMESIEGLQDAVNAAADSKFYVVTFDMGDDNQYHGDLTFAQIREKFEAGGNMVARIDGTDYIPLLSAATHQIIFSGIYQSQSVALTINASDVCTLTTTPLARSSHGHSAATKTTNGFMSSADKTKLDGIDISKYETKEDAQVKYDEILANQFTVQMITWEADD